MDIKASSGRAAGNAECIKLLKKWLAIAKRGQVSYVALAAGIAPDQVASESVGSIAFQADVCDQLDQLNMRLRQQMLARLAPYDPKVPPNYVTFSVSANNVNYDFLGWLIGAEMYRVRMGAPAPLCVGFYAVQEDAIKLPPIQLQMMKNVAGPLVEAIGGNITPVRFGRGDFCLTYRDVANFVRAGEKVPRLKAPAIYAGMVDAMLDGIPAPVTITLRESAHYLNRNSNLEAWCKLANDLMDEGEEVIFVRDTAKAAEPLYDFTTCQLASENILARIALYERAKCNLFVANGPATLNYFLPTPFLMFSEIDHDKVGTYEPAWPDWWPKTMGIEVGEQFPWFTPEQRIVWQTDSYSNLRAGWEEFRQRHETPQRQTHETGQAPAPSEIGAQEMING